MAPVSPKTLPERSIPVRLVFPANAAPTLFIASCRYSNEASCNNRSEPNPIYRSTRLYFTARDNAARPYKPIRFTWATRGAYFGKNSPFGAPSSNTSNVQLPYNNSAKRRAPSTKISLHPTHKRVDERCCSTSCNSAKSPTSLIELSYKSNAAGGVPSRRFASVAAA